MLQLPFNMINDLIIINTPTTQGNTFWDPIPISLLTSTFVIGYWVHKARGYQPNIVYVERWSYTLGCYQIYIVDTNDPNGLLLWFLIDLQKSCSTGSTRYFKFTWSTIKLKYNIKFNAILFLFPRDEEQCAIPPAMQLSPTAHLFRYPDFTSHECKIYQYRYLIWKSLHKTGLLSIPNRGIGTTFVNVNGNKMVVVFIGYGYWIDFES